MTTDNQKIFIKFPNKIELVVKREDLIHPLISGNKYRKLKYNIQQAQQEKYSQLVTFGGAYSNHIVAVAALANEKNMPSIGIIRGEELASKVADNPTLSLAQSLGMQFVFETRANYKIKDSSDYLERLAHQFPDAYIIPEGGTNELAVKGCQEILTAKDNHFDYICCAVGTGGTISGLSLSAQKHQQVLGFSALKTDYIQAEIHKFAPIDNWNLITDYHFGGYGKVTDGLISFINTFYNQHKIPLDPIYTGKMMYGILDLIEKGFFKESTKILAIHTGGLQGIKGMNLILQKQNKQQIEL